MRFILILGALAASALAAWRVEIDRPVERFRQISARIIEGHAYSDEALERHLTAIDKLTGSQACTSRIERSAAVIALRRMDMAREESSLVSAAFTTDAEQRVKRSLGCNPADPFLWLALAFMEKANGGSLHRIEALLAMSYDLGPREGWIASRRHGFAWTLFDALLPDTQNRIVHEFAHLVEASYFDDAMAALLGPGRPYHVQLMEALKDIGDNRRRAFSRLIYPRDPMIAIPGIERPEARPWR